MPRHGGGRGNTEHITADDAAKAILDLTRKLMHGPGRRTGGSRVAGRARDGGGGGGNPRSIGSGGALAGEIRDRNPMTAVGSLIIGSTGGSAIELLVGDEGDILVSIDGTPTWVARAEAVADTIYAEGDFVFDLGGSPVVV